MSHPRGAPYERVLLRSAKKFMSVLRLERCELSLSVVTDSAIRRLNRTWRGKDKATDVLSFPAGERPIGTPGPRPLGDVVLSLDTAARVAAELSSSVDGELTRYLAHGLLHLLGHDHQVPQDARQMAALEAKLLGRRGMI